MDILITVEPHEVNAIPFCKQRKISLFLLAKSQKGGLDPELLKSQLRLEALIK